jgi:hypothetical protein
VCSAAVPAPGFCGGPPHQQVKLQQVSSTTKRAGRCPRMFPCTRRLERVDALPHAVGRRRSLQSNSASTGWARYVLRVHFVTPRTVGGVLCRRTRCNARCCACEEGPENHIHAAAVLLGQKACERSCTEKRYGCGQALRDVSE